MKKYLTLIKTILWILVLFWLCSYRPDPNTTKIDFLELIHFDKIVHFGMFGILAFLIAHCFSKYSNSSKLIVSCVVSAMYGGIMEIWQEYLNYRGADFFDFIADLSGCIIAVLIYKRLVKIKFFKVIVD